MLRGLRQASNSWFGRAIMAAVMSLLVLSFAVWGIGDIFRGFGRSTFAKIGNTEIGIEQFRQLYRDRLQLFSRQIGRNITMDQARAAGIDQQLVRAIVSDFVLDERVRKLRLAVSDDEIRRRITSDPRFQGINGQFDRERFLATLRQMSTSEQRFVADERREILRRQLGGTFVGTPLVPDALVEAVERYQNEERSIDYVLLNRALAGEVEEPTAEALAAYFQDRKMLFRFPEFRKIVVMGLLPAEQARWLEISDDDLKSIFEQRRTRFTIPERRQVQQMVFPNADEARAAAERIGKGETFDAIAKERNLTEADIDIGTVTKASMLDPTVADATFALAENEVSAPVKGRFGTVLVRVLKIEPEKVPAFEEVATQLRNEISMERARSQITDRYAKIEDERSIGKTLAEAAETVKIAARTVEVDRMGRDASGMLVTGLPDPQRVLTLAFAAEPGVENDPIQFEGGYVWYEVLGITPSRERALDEVKEQVEQRWREDGIANRLKAKAAQIIDKVKSGTSLADAAEAEGLKVESKSGIKRAGPASPLSSAALDVLFRATKDAVATAQAEQPAEQVVFRVSDIIIPKVDPASDQAKQIRDTLGSAITEDLYGEFINYAQQEVGVTINQIALRQILTGQASTDN
jgi:peptidyl-prolyl cis-trans isomerase D